MAIQNNQDIIQLENIDISNEDVLNLIHFALIKKNNTLTNVYYAVNYINKYDDIVSVTYLINDRGLINVHNLRLNNINPPPPLGRTYSYQRVDDDEHIVISTKMLNKILELSYQ
jgi:hypothetical protein